VAETPTLRVQRSADQGAAQVAVMVAVDFLGRGHNVLAMLTM
jgi:hypothetical protein